MLVRDIKETRHGADGKFTFALFNKEVTVSIDNIAHVDLAEKSAQLANSMDDELILHLCEASTRYCNDFLRCMDQPERSFSSPLDILPLIQPSVLMIPEPNEKYQSVLHFELNCEWEREHGMEWLIRDGKVLYVGAFNGEYEWRDIKEYEGISNFA